jgi:hypothetical protein
MQHSVMIAAWPVVLAAWLMIATDNYVRHTWQY